MIAEGWEIVLHGFPISSMCVPSSELAQAIGPGQTDSESEERPTTFQVGTLEELDDHAESAA